MKVIRLEALILSLITVALAACGGGNSGGGSSPPSSPDFTVTLSSSSLTLDRGGEASTTVTVNAENGFNSAVAFSVTGLPGEITSSPSTLQSSPGSPLTITFLAATSAAAGSVNVTLTGASGAFSHSTKIGMTVKSTVVTQPNFRTRYLRTDAVTEYFSEPNSKWMVFDPIRDRFFVSDPWKNQIDVLDPRTETKIGSIAVPGAYGIDETPDHSVIYAGTQIGDIYAIDPAAMKVTHRYPAAQIGVSGYQAFEVRVLANGQLALLGGQGGIPSVDGYGSVALWSPLSNVLTVYNNFSHLGAFTLTGDRSLIVLGGLLSPGGFCTLDPATGRVACVNTANSFLYNLATTPDGKSILVPYSDVQIANDTVISTGQILVYDATTLTQTSAFTVNGDLSSAASMIVSPDSKTLYMGNDGGFLYAYDLATGTQIGWLPTLSVLATTRGHAVGAISNPNLQAFDDTGLLAGPMEEGVGFLDTTALKTGTVGTEFVNDLYLVPATGPAEGGTATQWRDMTTNALMASAYFGGNWATSLSQGSGLFPNFYATTPAGAPGPADLYAVMEDGGTLIVPEAFSYGPTILQVTPDAATAEGGGNGVIYGYGFGSTANNATFPSDLLITVDGKTATVTAFNANAYGLSDPPFNLQAVAYTIPPDPAGSKADVTVTTSSGTAKASAALSYLPALKQFPLQGASLAQGVYDAKRDLYYFTYSSEIEVFSRTKGQWLTPIQVPNPPLATTHRLWGIALSPNGSSLAVSDIGASAIYLFNPDEPASVQSYVYNASDFFWAPLNGPAGLAVSDSGNIYFSSADGFFKLDTAATKFVKYADGPRVLSWPIVGL